MWTIAERKKTRLVVSEQYETSPLQQEVNSSQSKVEYFSSAVESFLEKKSAKTRNLRAVVGVKH